MTTQDADELPAHPLARRHHDAIRELREALILVLARVPEHYAETDWYKSAKALAEVET